MDESPNCCEKHCVRRRQRRIHTVSELCQMPVETPAEHRGLATHTEGPRCEQKCSRRSALVPFGVRPHARPESISKRAPSTTRTSLRAFRILHLAPFAKWKFANCDRNCDTPPSACDHLRSQPRRHQCRLSAQRGERPSIIRRPCRQSSTVRSLRRFRYQS